MADPGEVQDLFAQPGPHPQTLYINATALVADPVVTSYHFYIDGQTGVGKTQFDSKFTTSRSYITTPVLPQAEKYFVTITAENSEAEGDAVSEVEVAMS